MTGKKKMEIKQVVPIRLRNEDGTTEIVLLSLTELDIEEIIKNKCRPLEAKFLKKS